MRKLWGVKYTFGRVHAGSLSILPINHGRPSTKLGRSVPSSTTLTSSLGSAVLALLLSAAGIPAVFANPTVNGLYYGDGDVDRYSFLRPDTSGATRGSVHIAIDDTDPNKVYIALVVDEQTSDTVCGGTDDAYTASVGWGNNRNSGDCKRAIDSEYASFGISCNADNDNDVTSADWEWHQATAYPVDENGNEVATNGQAGNNIAAEDYVWRSDHLGGTGDDVTPIPAPGLTSASSWSYNLTAVGDGDIATLGTGFGNWKTPDINNDNDLLLELEFPDEYRIDIDPDSNDPNGGGGVVGDGYLTGTTTASVLSGSVYWEWPLVYEFSFDASQCNGPIYISPGESHNSPSKDGLGEDVSFPPPETTDPLSDLGDAPDTYGTDLTDGGEGMGPRHEIVFGSSGVLRLGAALDTEGDGQPSINADGDDVDVSDSDEDGVTSFPTPNAQIAGGDSYTVAVNATNTTAGTAELCGWIDFDLNGGPEDGTFEQDERACVTVPQNTASDDSTVQCTDNEDGTFACDVTFTVPSDFTEVDGESTYARFRLASDPNEVLSPTGTASNGEVEDYVVPASSLPVSLNSFESRVFGNVLDVEWSTASETFNVGFDVWAKVHEDWQRLNEQPVLSKALDAVTPQEYSIRLSLKDVDPRAIEGLALSSIEANGNQELYGTFEVGEEYGDQALPEPIAWDVVREEHDAAMRRKGYEKRGGKWRRSPDGGAANSPFAEHPVIEVLVTEPGMQRVTFEELRAQGLDLAGVRPNAIAVTLKDQAVARRVEAGRGNGGFGPGGYIDFWGEQPGYPDALYVADYVYRIEVDHKKAVRAGVVRRRTDSGVTSALEPLHVNEDVGYQFLNATADPWHAAMLIYPWGPERYTATVEIDPALVPGSPGRVEAELTAFSDFPNVDPDHRVRLAVNGTTIVEQNISGHRAVTLTGIVPANALSVGANTVTVELPGTTAAPFDIVTVDTVTLSYPRRLEARDDRLHVQGDVVEQGLLASGFSRRDLVAYGRQIDGSLAELRVETSRADHDWDAAIPTVGTHEGTRYWISSSAGLIRPDILGTVAERDLLSQPADFLLIAHPAFMPAEGDDSHPLNRYMKRRESQGWNVRAVGVDAIQNAFGGGMALPEAVTRFLSAADEAFDYTHVLLVGDDSYDYLDKLGLGSLSFVPTMYADTNMIHHSPSDGLLTDLNGDGLSDKAVGRWPVRTLTDLEVMVRKTLDWEDPFDGTRDDRSSVWVTDSQDPNVPSFQAQAERMIDTLRTPVAGGSSEPWPDENITRVYFDEVVPERGRDISQTARKKLMKALSAGQTITGFAGHGSPTAWTFQGLLSPRDVSDMKNDGMPSLFTALTCYTTYFVSPYSNTLTHRLMAGYRRDANGNEVPGVANGAVAVHGAATLSGYADNEQLAREALQQQIQEGETLGEAIRNARVAAFAAGQMDTATNWALLGDPTLTIEP